MIYYDIAYGMSSSFGCRIFPRSGNYNLYLRLCIPAHTIPVSLRCDWIEISGRARSNVDPIFALDLGSGQK